MNVQANSSVVNGTSTNNSPSFSPGLITMSESHITTLIVLYSSVLLLSVIGNAYIIAIVLRNKQMHSTINYLIVNMALSDFVGSIATISPSLSFFHYRSYEWKVAGNLGSIICKTCPFIRDLSITVSILSMEIIGLDRFFAVVFPMKPIPRILNIRIALPAIWLIAAASFAINFFRYKLVFIFGMNLCITEWPSNLDPIQASTIFYSILIVVYFILPFIITTLLYIAIVYTIKQQKTPGHQSTKTEKRRLKRNIAIIKMAFTIVACFFACWFPYHTLTILELFVWKDHTPTAILPFYDILEESTSLLSFVSFFINPVVCFIFSSNYRKYLRNTFPFNVYCLNRVGIMDNSSTIKPEMPRSQHTMNTIEPR